MKGAISWDIKLCSMLKVNRRFGGTCSLHFQNEQSRTTSVKTEPYLFLPREVMPHVVRIWKRCYKSVITKQNRVVIFRPYYLYTSFKSLLVWQSNMFIAVSEYEQLTILDTILRIRSKLILQQRVVNRLMYLNIRC
jgi:hypothetical protein